MGVGDIMAENVADITDANFDSEVLKPGQPVLVDFWAPWCGPCRMVGPVVEELAGENAGVVKVVKVNVDESPQAAQSYGISSIPTVVMFNQGKEVSRFIGVKPKSAYQEAIDGVRG